MKTRLVVKTHTRPRGYIDDYHPQAKTLVLLNQAVAVLTEYRTYWPLTVRQIFYRLVGAYAYEKSERAYKGLCAHLSNARRGGMIQFRAIRDDGVSVWGPTHYANPDAFWAEQRERAANYERDKQEHQPRYIEVWCESAGMQPQLARVTDRFSINVYSSSGFDSLTAKYDLAQRICDAGKSAVVLHLGDFDPSGESIFTSLTEDVRAFVQKDRIDARIDVEFRRVALTAEQVERYNLPTAPPKASDSRSTRWAGETCQLEALAPDQIAGLLEEAILDIIDVAILLKDEDEEVGERQRIAYLLPAGGAA